MSEEINLLMTTLTVGAGLVGVIFMVWTLKDSILTLMGDFFRGGGPYFAHIVTDLLIVFSLWSMLFVFKTTVQYLPSSDFVSKLVSNVHGVGTILAFVVFAYLFITDVIKIRSAEIDRDIENSKKNKKMR